MKLSLTDKFLENCKTMKAQEDFFDAVAPGLALRVTLAGRKTWTFVYTPPGRPDARARITLGHYPALSLLNARIKAGGARTEVDLGNDPAQTVVAPPVVLKTVSDVFTDWVEMRLKPKGRRSLAEIERRFNANVKPVVGDVPMKHFRIDPHLNSVLDPIIQRGSPIAANRIFGDVRSLFNFAVKRGVIDYSPIDKADKPAEEGSRDRWLTADEILAVWVALPTAFPRAKGVVTILKLCLATGQRIGEVLGMTRGELDLKAKTWTIPAARAKNAHEHVVPLNTLAFSLITDALMKTNGDFVFPNQEGDGPQKHHVVNQAIRLAEEKKKFGIPHWTPHDLRRTVATQMSLALAVPELHISHVLNHISVTKGSITSRVYNKNTYLPEKKAALDKWGEYLAHLVGVQLDEAA